HKQIVHTPQGFTQSHSTQHSTQQQFIRAPLPPSLILILIRLILFFFGRKLFSFIELPCLPHSTTSTPLKLLFCSHCLSNNNPRYPCTFHLILIFLISKDN